jgi:DNA-binding XRE family transcriptional regulator
MTQSKLAALVGVSRQVICNIENDAYMPSKKLRERIAKLFGVSVVYLLSGKK